MKNFVKWLGIIAMVAVIGFTFTACGDGGDDGNGNGNGNGNGTGGVGYLTVQNLPDDVYVYAVVVYDYSDPVTNKSEYNTFRVASNYGSSLSIGGSTTGSSSPIHLYDTNDYSKYLSRSGSFLVAFSWTSNVLGNGRSSVFSQVKFTNGNATINWNKPSYQE